MNIVTDAELLEMLEGLEKTCRSLHNRLTAVEDALVHAGIMKRAEEP